MAFETINIMFNTLLEFVVFTAHRFVGVDFMLYELLGAGAEGRIWMNFEAMMQMAGMC